MPALLPAFSLRDLGGRTQVFPRSTKSVICFVKEDCPTCNLVLPLIEALHKQSGLDILITGQTAEGNDILASRHALTAPVLDDSALNVSFAYDVETVPLVIAVDGEGTEADRLVGFEKSEWRAFFERHAKSTAVDWETYPDWRPGCGSLTQDPIINERLRAASENSPLRARRIEIAPDDDVHEFMFDQGFSDGLPVVPPTPERVLRMLEGTARDPQSVVATVPPNMAPATVEKIAVNAVLAGCTSEYLPVIIAAIEGRLHGHVQRPRRHGHHHGRFPGHGRQRPYPPANRHEHGAFRVGSGQPRQRHHRPRRAPRPSQCRRRASRWD